MYIYNLFLTYLSMDQCFDCDEGNFYGMMGLRTEQYDGVSLCNRSVGSDNGQCIMI